MSRYSDSVNDNYGRPVSGARVYVYDLADPENPVLETLTDDDASPLDNPLTTDKFGAFHFNADDGDKQLDIWFGGVRRWREEVLVGPQPAGPPGPAGEVAKATTRAALKATAASAEMVRYLAEAGREGIFIFRASDLSSLVAADTHEGIYIAPDSDPDGSSGAWVRVFEYGANPNWFLVDGRTEFVTDDLAAWECALAVLKARREATDIGSERLIATSGRFYWSDTLNIHQKVHIEIGADVIILLANNKNGIVFNYATTHGDGLGVQGDASGSTLRLDGMLYGGNVQVDGAGVITSYGGGDSPTGHGIRNRAVDVEISGTGIVAFFGGDLLNNDATNGSGDSTTGNANGFKFSSLSLLYGGRYGCLISGSDANAGSTDQLSIISCAGGGLIDLSFLGNGHTDPHVRDCGNTDPLGNDAPVGTCTYGGLSYYADANQLALCSTQQPGTGSAWIQKNGIGATKPWVSGRTWLIGAPYATNPTNDNNYNCQFRNAYAESAQSPIQAFGWTLFLGGLVQEVGFSPNSADKATHIQGGRGSVNSRGFFASVGTTKGTSYGSVGGVTGSIEYVFRHSDGVRNWDLVEDGGNMSFATGGFGVPFQWLTTGLGLPAGKTLTANGRTAIDGNGTYVPPPHTTQGGTAYEAVLTDANGYIEFTNGSAVTFTIPANATVAFPIGTEITIEQAGAGALTVAAAGTVTINSRGSDLTLAGQYAVAVLKKKATNTWILTGDL